MTKEPPFLIRGARSHNLKGVDLVLEKGRFIVFTGPSGSGKTSLAFDTLFAEGQRKFIESLSSYAKQFIKQAPRPEVDYISGLTPSISIEQKIIPRGSRSTVSTTSEIQDIFKILYSNFAQPFCYQCGNKIQKAGKSAIQSKIQNLELGAKISIYSPLIKNRKGSHTRIFAEQNAGGYSRFLVNGVLYNYEDIPKLEAAKKHTLAVLIDRIVLKSKESDQSRLAKSLEQALAIGNGELIIESNSIFDFFSQNSTCPDCNISYPKPDPRMFSFNSSVGWCLSCEGTGEENEDEKTTKLCGSCDGGRLSKISSSFKICDISLPNLLALSCNEATNKLQLIKKDFDNSPIINALTEQALSTLDSLTSLGLGYLTLNRTMSTLSGGEAQRVRLAAVLGSPLTGVTYVLDEPSIGLHPRDTAALIQKLKDLVSNGNSVFVVEHDLETMIASDFLVDMGPGAGKEGGEILYLGPTNELLSLANNKTKSRATTLPYISGEKKVKRMALPVPTEKEEWISFGPCKAKNLNGFKAKLPLNRLTCISGVSGSGKSTLLFEELYPFVLHEIEKNKGYPIQRVVIVDQAPIGRTSRSNAATYTGVFDEIRKIMAMTPEAKIRGLSPSDFSFNVEGGRCQNCSGSGTHSVTVAFLPPVESPCPSCKGRRYLPEMSEIQFKNKDIMEILSMPVSEAANLFKNIPKIGQYLEVLNEFGLHYITLGQSSTSLSGGEAQRIKLATELFRSLRNKDSHTLILLDEPTTGLHFGDIQKLLDAFDHLLQSNNTIVLIEHNTDVIKGSDYLIEIGPEAGPNGGSIVFEGSITQCKKSKSSLIKKYL